MSNTTTTSEDWLPEWVGLEFPDLIPTLNDAHNAAIAAERESRKDYQGEAYELNLKLATAVEALKEFENEYPHVTRVLAKLEGQRQ